MDPWRDLLIGGGTIAAIAGFIRYLVVEVFRSKDQTIAYWRERALSVEKKVDEVFERTVRENEQQEEYRRETDRLVAKLTAEREYLQRLLEEGQTEGSPRQQKRSG